MANTAQAKKRARQNEKRRARNAALRTQFRTAIKKVRKAIAAGDREAALKQMQASQSVIDRIADKGVVHKNTAARAKSRLMRALKALAPQGT
ncbi:MAG: 30S ribosomal protein S20 [Casimicrobiaceae bacterium]|nr:30S ribosomal protein S20 [Casimicrobiaceae bacterium]MCX8098557.1 30S ribosomal protein S20 [Casimicrobiaceae bacterium]MDW8313185.1 30S ribosomal protein S20 [Burkholderiales bacterium]